MTMPDEEIQAVVDALVKQGKNFEKYFVNLTDEERSGLRTMAEGREGYVREVNLIALANPDELRRKDDPELLDRKLKYDEALERMRLAVLSLYEKIEETQLANSKDIMKVADSFVNALQNSRGRDSALDKSMIRIDEYNKRFASQKTEPVKETVVTVAEEKTNV